MSVKTRPGAACHGVVCARNIKLIIKLKTLKSAPRNARLDLKLFESDQEIRYYCAGKMQ